MGLLDGKIALNTGAGTGIGRGHGDGTGCDRHRRGQRHRPATAQRMHDHGWSVIAAGRDAERLAWTQEAGIAAMTVEVTSEADNRALVAEAESRFGGLDAAVFNARVTGGGAITLTSSTMGVAGDATSALSVTGDPTGREAQAQFSCLLPQRTLSDRHRPAPGNTRQRSPRQA